VGRGHEIQRYTLSNGADRTTHPRPWTTQTNSKETRNFEVILGSGSAVCPFLCRYIVHISDQIRSPQEKVALTPPPAPTQPQPIHTPAPPPGLSEQPPRAEEAATPPEPEPPVPTAWEDPTTVQESTWEEEPQAPVIQTQPEPAPGPESEVEEPPNPRSPEPASPQVQEPVLSALPAQVQNQEVERSPTPTSAVKRPSSSAAHRHNARFKTGDQAVVMPTGNYTPNIEKIGMQFGSLRLGGDGIDGCVSHDLFTKHFSLQCPQ